MECELEECVDKDLNAPKHKVAKSMVSTLKHCDKDTYHQNIRKLPTEYSDKVHKVLETITFVGLDVSNGTDRPVKSGIFETNVNAYYTSKTDHADDYLYPLDLKD